MVENDQLWCLEVAMKEGKRGNSKLADIFMKASKTESGASIQRAVSEPSILLQERLAWSAEARTILDQIVMEAVDTGVVSSATINRACDCLLSEPNVRSDATTPHKIPHTEKPPEGGCEQ